MGINVEIEIFYNKDYQIVYNYFHTFFFINNAFTQSIQAFSFSDTKKLFEYIEKQTFTKRQKELIKRKIKATLLIKDDIIIKKDSYREDYI